MASSHCTLPKTIEGATARYINTYAEFFKGGIHDRNRLRDYAQAKIFALRKKAPKFYEKKLPEIVNQACSALLTCDMNTTSGIKNFNETHADFLRVLDELKKTQPSGDINFQKERDRSKAKEDYRKRHLAIREEIDRLEALEFDNDEIGDETSYESRYLKTFDRLDKLKKDLKCTATLIAKMEGCPIEEDYQFKLVVNPRTSLERLNMAQRNNLEQMIKEYLDSINRAKDIPDKNTVEAMLEKLNLDPAQFRKDELHAMPKEIMDSIRFFFRNIENERRNEYYDSLCTNKRLLPREGMILSSPDDIPDHVREQLELSERRSQRKLDEYYEEYSKKQCDEENVFDDIEEDLNNQDFENEIDEVIKQNSDLFARVKEEPRDDYDYDDSDDEILVGDTMASSIEQALRSEKNNNITISNNNNNKDDDESEISDFQDTVEHFDTEKELDGDQPEQHCHSSQLVESSRYQMPDAEKVANDLQLLLDQEDDLIQPKPVPSKRQKVAVINSQCIRENSDDDFVVLGTVEPKDKCEIINLSSDED